MEKKNSTISFKIPTRFISSCGDLTVVKSENADEIAYWARLNYTVEFFRFLSQKKKMKKMKNEYILYWQYRVPRYMLPTCIVRIRRFSFGSLNPPAFFISIILDKF